MSNYIKHFKNPYPDGYQDRPSEETPETAAILNMKSQTLEAIETYLVDNPIPSKTSDLNNNSGFVTADSPTFTGTPKAPTPADADNSTRLATTAYVKTLISNLVNGAPETLDTLKEIADALEENDDVVQALNEAIANKADKTEIPTVNNGTLTIQKNGTNVQTFSANQSGNTTANLIVPTKTSELQNDSRFSKINRIDMSVTTNDKGIAPVGVQVNDKLIVSTYSKGVRADIIIPFVVGESWWIKAIKWIDNNNVINEEIDITIFYLENTGGGVNP